MTNALPDRILAYLTGRGLTTETLERNHISWDGERIVIPIFDKNGVWLFNKYRRDPLVEEGPKYTYDKGSSTQLYGIEKMQNAPSVIICEGEFDALILEEHGYVAVSSTGGSQTFKEEWASEFKDKEVYTIFDNDDAGRKGIFKLHKILPHAKNIPIPFNMGRHADVTDYFIKYKKTQKDFATAVKFARAIVIPEEDKPVERMKKASPKDDRLGAAKEVPLSVFLKFNGAGFARCPFHKEKTPSLHWIKRSNKWNCFGCNEHGDTVDLVMKMYTLSMKEAIGYILKHDA